MIYLPGEEMEAQGHVRGASNNKRNLATQVPLGRLVWKPSELHAEAGLW